MIVFAGSRLKGMDSDGNTQPISVIGPESDTLKTADDESRDLLYDIIKELRIMNLHLSLMTDNVIQRGDLG